MSPLKFSLRSFLLAAALTVSLPLGAMAEKDLAVFSPKDSLAEGWKASGWAGMSTSEVPAPAKGTTMLEATISGEAEPYCGAVLTANAGSGFNLSEKALDNGFVSLTLAPGKDAQGQPAAAEQIVQIGITFLASSGETIHGGFNKRVVLDPAGPHSGKQEVEIPLKEAVKGISVAPEELTNITGVRIQLVDAPIAGFAVLDCKIKED